MINPPIEPEHYRYEIESLLRSVNLRACEILIVDSVRAWATSVGISEKDAERIAMAATAPGGHPIIVLRKHITADAQRGVKDLLWFRSFTDEEIRMLDSPARFLEHLVLHEAAHHLLDNPSEADCDRWAFEHLTGHGIAGAT